MAEGTRTYQLKDLNLTIADTTPPEKPKPPAPDYLANILLIALVFETITLITFAKGDAGAAGAVTPASQINPGQDCGTTRAEVVRILIRQRNTALRNAHAERAKLNERAWNLVADVLDQVRDQVDDRFKALAADGTESLPRTQLRGCVDR